MSITSDILRGHTEAIILSHLLEHDSYGYQINKDIMKKTNNAYEQIGRASCRERVCLQV